jgi:hypothetical protein
MLPLEGGAIDNLPTCLPGRRETEKMRKKYEARKKN